MPMSNQLLQKNKSSGGGYDKGKNELTYLFAHLSMQG